MDLAHDLAPATVAALDQAEVIVLPITPELNSIRLASAALGVFKALGYDKEIVLVLNQTIARPTLTRAQIEKALKQTFALALPFADTAFGQGINVGVPVMMGSPDAAVSTVLEDLAWRVSDPQMRQTKPAEPTPTWQRVAQRQGMREAAKK